MYRDNHL